MCSGFSPIAISFVLHRVPKELQAVGWGGRLSSCKPFTGGKMNYPTISDHSLRYERAQCKQCCAHRKTCFSLPLQRRRGLEDEMLRLSDDRLSEPRSDRALHLNLDFLWTTTLHESQIIWRKKIRCLWRDSLHLNKPKAMSFLRDGWTEALWGEKGEVGVSWEADCAGCSGKQEVQQKTARAAGSVLEMGRWAMTRSWSRAGCYASWTLVRPEGTQPWCYHMG